MALAYEGTDNAMGKADVDINLLSEEQIQTLAASFGIVSIESCSRLYGGFSGTNYLLTAVFAANDGKEGARCSCVLKVCNGYSTKDVQGVSDVLQWLKYKEFTQCCYTMPLCNCHTQVSATSNDTFSKHQQFVSVALGEDRPAILMTYVEGVAADKVAAGAEVPLKVICDQKRSACNTASSASVNITCAKSPKASAASTYVPIPSVDLLRAVGQSLARMHMVGIPDHSVDTARLRHFSEGGCCEVQHHIDGDFSRRLTGCGYQEVLDHEFLQFYMRKLEGLRTEMALSDILPQAPLHGDAFLDNMLVTATVSVRQNEKGDEIVSKAVPMVRFIDFEDACVGPCLFDLAACIIGCCYTDATNELDFDHFEALLSGYDQARPLTALESVHLLPFMRLALLCNCTWRFYNFNVEHRELQSANGDSFKELYDRIRGLDTASLAGAVTSAVMKICNAKAARSE